MCFHVQFWLLTKNQSKPFFTVSKYDKYSTYSTQDSSSVTENMWHMQQRSADMSAMTQQSHLFVSLLVGLLLLFYLLFVRMETKKFKQKNVKVL